MLCLNPITLDSCVFQKQFLQDRMGTLFCSSYGIMQFSYMHIINQLLCACTIIELQAYHTNIQREYNEKLSFVCFQSPAGSFILYLLQIIMQQSSLFFSIPLNVTNPIILMEKHKTTPSCIPRSGFHCERVFSMIRKGHCFLRI